MKKNLIRRTLFAIAVVLLAMVALGSCSSKSEPSYLIGGEATFESAYFFGLVSVFEDAQLPCVDGATVSINGEALDYNFFYYSNLDLAAVAPGDSVTFSVDIGGVHINQAVAMPGLILSISPVGGPDFEADQPLEVTWGGYTGSDAPQYVQVSVSLLDTVSEDGYEQIVPYDEMGATIPAGTFDTGSATIYIDGVNTATLGGAGVISGSELKVSNRTSIDVNIVDL